MGGYRLHIRCSGEAREGTPAVIMDAGNVDTSDAWDLAQPKVAAFARVCSYDVTGTGRSEGAPKPPTSLDIVRDLHALLTNAGVEAPYVLVGHSFGGINARLYASRYPREVVGMVLVDSSHEGGSRRAYAGA